MENQMALQVMIIDVNFNVIKMTSLDRPFVFDKGRTLGEAVPTIYEVTVDSETKGQLVKVKRENEQEGCSYFPVTVTCKYSHSKARVS
jgi:hypothetical protein